MKVTELDLAKHIIHYDKTCVIIDKVHAQYDCNINIQTSTSHENYNKAKTKSTDAIKLPMLLHNVHVMLVKLQ